MLGKLCALDEFVIPGTEIFASGGKLAVCH
jgi:hypothetical protein